MVKMVWTVLLVHKVQEAIQVKLELQVKMVLMEKQVLKVNRVLQDQWDHKVSKALKEKQVLKVLKEFRVIPELLDPKDRKAIQDKTD
jgi:hypothetical protein